MHIQHFELNQPVDADLTDTFALIVKGGVSFLDYQWVLDLRNTCLQNHIVFIFESTGENFIKDGIRYNLDPKTARIQAQRADINVFYHERLFDQLSKSSFRSRFQLRQKEIEYIDRKRWDTICSHAKDIITSRLVPQIIPNDGRQTPMKGHPVFIAQHATATCCKGCLYKWHHIAKDKALDDWQTDYVVSVIMEWILKQYIVYKSVHS